MLGTEQVIWLLVGLLTRHVLEPKSWPKSIPLGKSAVPFASVGQKVAWLTVIDCDLWSIR